jgi:GxxExxY protein
MNEQKDPQTFAIIGAAMEVHRLLGDGFLEAVYQKALAIELSLRNIPFEREAAMTISYKGSPLECKYRADFVCSNEIIVEVKSIKSISAIEEAQVLNYLKASGLHRALLINFGAPSLQFKRFVLDYKT